MKKALSLILISLVLGACQKDRNNDPVANVREAAKDKDLQGKTFTSECSIKPLDAIVTGLMTGGESSVKSQQVAYRFDLANVIRQTRLYNSTDCTGDSAYNFEEAGTMNIETDPNKKSNDQGRNIELDYKTVKATVTSDAGVTAANATKLCGIADWAPNKARDITAQAKDLNCYAAQVPRHVSNIYRVDNSVLFLGSQSKGSVAPNERPSSLDMTVKYTAK